MVLIIINTNIINVNWVTISTIPFGTYNILLREDEEFIAQNTALKDCKIQEKSKMAVKALCLRYKTRDFLA